MNSSILAFPDFTLQSVLLTDASDSAIGAVLSKTQDGRERVLGIGADYSKRLKETTVLLRRKDWQ